MLVRRKSACKTSAGSSKILRWLTPLLGPNLDPKTEPKQRSIFGPKNGVSDRRISLLPRADLRPCSLNINSYLFLFVRSKSVFFFLWDTNAKINGLVAEDLETLVSQVLSDFPYNTGFADGLFVMTTATDHKNNLNRSTLKKDYARTLRVETIANSAGGTAAVAMAAQPSTGFLNGRFHPDGSPTEDTEDCLGRITVGLTRAKSLTLVVSPLDMMGLIGMVSEFPTGGHDSICPLMAFPCFARITKGGLSLSPRFIQHHMSQKGHVDFIHPPILVSVTCS